jgi:hypothetical protein
MSIDEQLLLLYLREAKNAAEDHKRTCERETCGVTMRGLHVVALRAAQTLESIEARNKAAEILSGWPL